MRHSAKKNVNPAPEAEIPEWNKLQSQINIVIGSVRDNAITIAQLKKDILDTFAYDLNRAAQTYEYTSIEEMLSDMVGYVHVRHTPGGVIVSAAVVGSSAHVTEMIQKTKGKTRKKTNRATTLMRSGYRPHSHLPQPSRGRGQRRRGAAPFRTTHTVPSFGSSLPQSSVRPSSSRCYFGNQPSSSHVYRPAPVYESPFFDSPPLRTNVPSFGGPPQPPLSTQDSSAKLRPSVPSLRSAPSQSSSVRFATSASARLPSSQNFSFRPLLHKSFSSLSTQGSSINLRHSVPSFGPPPSQPLLSTQDSSVKLRPSVPLFTPTPSQSSSVRFATSGYARFPSSQNASIRPVLPESFSPLSTQDSSVNLRPSVPSLEPAPSQHLLSTQDSSVNLQPSVPSLRPAPSQSSSVRFATSASARFPSSQNASIRLCESFSSLSTQDSSVNLRPSVPSLKPAPSQSSSIRPVLPKSFSPLSTQDSSINLRPSVPSFGPPPSQPLLSTQDSSVNLWRHLLLGSKRPSSNRPVPPPRSAVPSHSTFIPEKTEDPLKPRILSPSEALLWKKKTFADYATKVSFKSAVKN